MKMTKEQALQKIEELKQYIEEQEKNISNVVTIEPVTSSDYQASEININDRWAGRIFHKEIEGDIFHGHRSSLYLNYGTGKWYDKNGYNIQGYLFYIPENDQELIYNIHINKG